MKRTILILTVFILCINLLIAKDITQISEEDNPQYLFSITHGAEFIGDIKVEMFAEVAPKHVHNFDSLVSIEFYNGCAFHRVIPGFMIQGGCPNSKDKPKDTWGYGDPSQTRVPAEFSNLNHLRGILSAARLGGDDNSATSQFFICVANAFHLDGKYSIYGEVLEGMDVVDIIVNVPRDGRDNPLEKVEMTITKVEPSNISERNNGNKELLIYPNPVNDAICFKSGNENLMIKSFELSDISGKIILNNKYSVPMYIEEIRIPTDDLSNGIYLIKIIDTLNKVCVLKIVVN
ncbi:peptidylprolyl isomerase [Bacteroidota bacterium]